VATPKKKTSKKRKAKKARKSPRASARQNAVAKKRAAKSKRVVKKPGKAKKAAKKIAKAAKKRAARKSSKKPAKKSVKTALTKRADSSSNAPVASAKAPSTPKSAKAVAPRAKPAPAVTPPLTARNTYFVTTPIFYPNGVPHIGHAYTAMVTDAIAGFQRLDGFDVLFLTGTDEHGLKMQQTAVAEDLTPIALADRNSARFRDMMTALNISYDDYIRTTEPRHEHACQALWRAIESNGDIYLGKYAGWYSVRQEAYFDESETTVGPDGIRREPLGSPVEWTEEETYFFRLSAYQDRLLDLYARVPDFVLPRERLNEVASFVKGGLQDLSVSRTTFDWGIKVPGAPDHVMYVWIDALTNYITAAG
jgi:hypothetical protein